MHTLQQVVSLLLLVCNQARESGPTGRYILRGRALDRSEELNQKRPSLMRRNTPAQQWASKRNFNKMRVAGIVAAARALSKDANLVGEERAQMISILGCAKSMMHHWNRHNDQSKTNALRVVARNG